MRPSYDLKTKAGRSEARKGLSRLIKVILWLVADTVGIGKTYWLMTFTGQRDRSGVILSPEALKDLPDPQLLKFAHKAQERLFEETIKTGKAGFSMGYTVGPNNQMRATHASVDLLPDPAPESPSPKLKQITVKSGRGSKEVHVNPDRPVSYLTDRIAVGLGYKPGGVFDLVREADKKVLAADLSLGEQWDDDKTVFWLAEIGSAV